MTIFEKINEGIKEAMRSRDQLRLETLRMLKAKILAFDARGNVSDPDVIKLFKTYQGNLQEALEQSIQANRPEMVDKLRKEMVIVQEFLPKAPSLEETRNIVAEAIKESGATTRKDLGLVMKAAMKANSAIDGKVARELIFELLKD